MSTYKNVLLIGASGNIGAPILAALLASGQFNVTVLSRASSTSTFPSGVLVIKSDYTPASLVAAFKGQDAVISTITTHAAGASQTAFVDAAVEADVKRFVTSDFGSDIENPRVTEVVPILKGKAELVDYLRTKEAAGLSWTAVVNGAFFEYGLETTFLGFNLKERKATLYDDGTTKTTLTTYAKIANSVVALLSTAAAQTANRYVHIHSFVVSQSDIQAALERAIGAPFTVTKSSTAHLRETGLAALQAGGGPDVGKLILYGIFGAGNGGDYGLTKNDNGLLGLEEESLDDAITRYVEAHQ